MLEAVIFGGTITENKRTKKHPLFLKARALTIFKGKTWSRRWVKTVLTVLSDPQKVLRRELFICLILSLPTSIFLFCWTKLKIQMSPLYPSTLKGESQSIPHNLSFPFKTGPVLHIHYHIKITLPEACISCCAVMSSGPQLSAWEFRTQIFNSKL